MRDLVRERESNKIYNSMDGEKCIHGSSTYRLQVEISFFWQDTFQKLILGRIKEFFLDLFLDWMRKTGDIPTTFFVTAVLKVLLCTLVTLLLICKSLKPGFHLLNLGEDD
jgi:hypothetical protein